MPHCNYTVQVKFMPKIRGEIRSEIKGFKTKPHLLSLQTDDDGKQF